MTEYKVDDRAMHYELSEEAVNALRDFGHDVDEVDEVRPVLVDRFISSGSGSYGVKRYGLKLGQLEDSLSFHEQREDGSDQSPGTWLDREQVAELREVLDEYLGPILREFEDADGDNWYEVQPDVFRMAWSRARAEEVHEKNPTGGRSYQAIRNSHGPLTNIGEF